MTIQTRTMSSPVGSLHLAADERALIGLYFARLPSHVSAQSTMRPHPILDGVENELDQYFRGTRTGFQVPYRLEGTAFQQRVWQAVAEIPYGQTASYREIAERIEKPNAMRAVGAANGRNPISIIVPCHRVIGANGDLTGYGGGIPAKVWLLERENIPVTV